MVCLCERDQPRYSVRHVWRERERGLFSVVHVWLTGPRYQTCKWASGLWLTDDSLTQHAPHVTGSTLSPPAPYLNIRQSVISDALMEQRFNLDVYVTLRFTFRAFSRRFYPKWLTVSTFVIRSETIYRCRYSKDVHRTKCKYNREANPFSMYSSDNSYCRCYTIKYYE